MGEWFKLIASSVGTILTFLLGGMDLTVQFLLIAMVADFVTGVIRSAILGKLSSQYGYKGILKKVGILILVCVAVLIDNLTLGNGILRTLVIYYFIANECLSIIENLGESGVPIPKKLKNAILAFQKENDQNEEADTKSNGSETQTKH